MPALEAGGISSHFSFTTKSRLPGGQARRARRDTNALAIKKTPTSTHGRGLLKPTPPIELSRISDAPLIYRIADGVSIRSPDPNGIHKLRRRQEKRTRAMERFEGIRGEENVGEAQ